VYDVQEYGVDNVSVRSSYGILAYVVLSVVRVEVLLRVGILGPCKSRRGVSDNPDGYRSKCNSGNIE
jgi:hypothetical protein